MADRKHRRPDTLATGLRNRLSRSSAVELNDADADSGRPVAAVQRALQVMDAFLEAQSTLSLAGIAARTGLVKSTVLRLLATLEHQGYVIRTASGEFHVGPKPLALSNRFRNAVQPHDIVMPVLRDLVSQTQESASYVVRQHDVRVTLYRVDSPLPIRDYGSPGDVTPIGRGAAGRIFLAFPNGADPQNLGVNHQLVAVTHGEIHTGMTGMASPVFDSDGCCSAVVGLTGPDTRFTPAAIKRMEGLLIKAARTITERAGGDTRFYGDRFVEKRGPRAGKT
jgi:DNA-binding IclR family transcriptional regulator